MTAFYLQKVSFSTYKGMEVLITDKCRLFLGLSGPAPPSSHLDADMLRLWTEDEKDDDLINFDLVSLTSHKSF